MTRIETSTVAPSVDTRAVLRKDEALDIAFLLQLTIALAVLVGGVSLWMRWVAKRGLLLRSNAVEGRLMLLARLSLSPRSRVSLIQADGHKLLLTESAQAVHVQILPSPIAPPSNDGDPQGRV